MGRARASSVLRGTKNRSWRSVLHHASTLRSGTICLWLEIAVGPRSARPPGKEPPGHKRRMRTPVLPDARSRPREPVVFFASSGEAHLAPLSPSGRRTGPTSPALFGRRVCRSNQTVRALLESLGTRLEAELPSLHCSFVSSQTEQDGRVICSVELNRLMTQGLMPVESRNVSNSPAIVSPNSTRPKLARSGGRS
jgi:hypothetical protein